MNSILRNVRPWGGPVVDIGIADGCLVSPARLEKLPGRQEYDGNGDLLLPGLTDHHIHLLALAARRASLSLAGVKDEAGVRRALSKADGNCWIRAVDYDEAVAGIPDRWLLDHWISDRPLRLADRTGALRVLNSAALALIKREDWPPGAERNPAGELTGRFWREDAWLRTAIPPQTGPDLDLLGAELLSFGLTGLTDAGAANGPSEAALLSAALPQRLLIMGSEELVRGKGFQLGPLKLLIDERDPPPPEDLSQRICNARKAGRSVAAHCVTDGEIALFLAALDLAGGAMPGDRIEHGSVIPEFFMGAIAAAKLTVVTNPGFIHDRGDRYLRDVSVETLPDLYRIASLQRAGIAILAGSDAPYANPDPWLGMRSARDRSTADGSVISPNESLAPLEALRLYCSGSLSFGTRADLIICSGSLDAVLHDLSAERVRATFIDGSLLFSRN